METLTPLQRLQIVQQYYENRRSMKSVHRALSPTYTERTIQQTFGKIKNNFTLTDETRPIRPRAAVNENFAEDPEGVIRR